MNEIPLPRQRSTLELPERHAPSTWTETMSAGFKQENDVVALLNIMRRPAYDRDPNFNVLKALEESPLGLDNFRILAQAQSQEEFRAMEGRLREEQRQRQILAGAGFQGFVSGMVGAVFSPTMMIPLVGPARGARGMAQAFGLAATAATAQEAALWSDQLLRTDQETFAGIAAGTVLGGLLGSAAVYLRQADFAGIAKGMDGSSDEGAISQLYRTGDGSVVRTGQTPRLKMPPEFRGTPHQANQLGELNAAAPVVRRAVQEEGVTPARVRQLAADEAQPEAVRVLAKATAEEMQPRQVAAAAARAEGLPDEVVTAWADLRRLEEAPSGRPVERVDAAREAYAAAARANNVDPEETALRLRTREESMTPADALERARASRADEISAPRGPSQVGAAAADAQFVPHRLVEQPDGSLRMTPEHEFFEAGGFVDPTFVGRLAGKASPIYRLIQQQVSPALRRTTQKLGTAGLLFEGNKAGMVARAGGSVEERVNSLRDASIYKVMVAVRESYIEHMYGSAPSAVQRGIASRWIMFSGQRPGPGKLSFPEFKAEVSRALNLGDESPVPEVMKALKTAREILTDIKKYADEVSAERGLPDIIPEQVFAEGTSYAPHMFSPRIVAERGEEFISIFAKHVNEVLTEAAEARWQRIKEAGEADEDWLRIAQMSKNEAKKFKDELLPRVRDLDEQRKANQALNRAIELEEEARDLIRTRVEELEQTNVSGDRGVTRANRRQARNELGEQYEELMAEARKLRKAMPEADQEILKESKAANRQLKAVNDAIKRLDETTPEQRAAKAAERRARADERVEEFDDWVRELRATDVGVTAQGARFDFSEISRDIMTQIQHQIVGANGRFAQLDMLDSISGFRKHRFLDVDYSIKSQFLETDVEASMEMYLRSIIPDIELTKAFGHKEWTEIYRPVNDELDAYAEHLGTRKVDEKGTEITPERRAAEQRAFTYQRTQWANEVRALIDRLRNQRGLPENPNDIGYRIGRSFINWNVSTMMGPAAITSIPDAARSVMAYGLMSVMRDSWVPFIRGMVDSGAKQASRQVIREMKSAGIGVETYAQSRATAMLDIFETKGAQTKLERGLEWTAQMTPKIALFGQQTDINKMIAGRVTMSKFVVAIQDVMEGKATAQQRQMLANANLDDNYIRRIWHELQSPEGATKYEDVLLPNSENWKDMEAVRGWRAALKRESDRIIVVPGLERAIWSDANILGRMVFQFRSFTMAANTKLLMSGLQQRDMALFHMLQGTIFSLALGSLSYYIWAMTAGERQREEMRNAGWEHWMDQALYRSGLLGIFSEVQQMGAAIPATRPFTTFANSDMAGRRAQNVMGAVAGPSFGKGWDISQFLMGLDQPTEGTVRQARKLLPYQNVFYLRQALDMVQEGLAETLGLPEKRK